MRASRRKSLGRAAIVLPVLITMLLFPHNRSNGADAPCGFIVHLGCGDGRLTADLCRDSGVVVHGIDEGPSAVERARKHLREAGLYGRASVDCLALERLPYADNLANAVIVEDARLVLGKETLAAEIVRVLCPEGVALVGQEGEAGVLKARFKALGMGAEEVERAGRLWLQFRKPRPADMDEWTHSRYAANGHAVSGDRAGTPVGLRWLAGPSFPRVRKRGARAALTAGGRVFSVADEVLGAGEPEYVLTARDAYNGLPLWKLPLEGAPAGMVGGDRGDHCLVAAGEYLYAQLAESGPLVSLDAATGKTVLSYDEAFKAMGGAPTNVLYHDGRLVLTNRRTTCAVHAATGNVLWKRDLGAKSIVLGGGRVFTAYSSLNCLDARTGETLWSHGAADLRQLSGQAITPSLCFHQGDLLVVASFMGNHAFSAKDGKLLWTYKYSAPGHGGNSLNAFFLDGLVWVHAADQKTRAQAWVGLGPASGEEKKRIADSGKHRCHLDKATGRFILSSTMCFVDLEKGAAENFPGARNTCGIGVMPGNGLYYTFPHGCLCVSGMMRGVLALAPTSTAEPAPVAEAARVQKGPAFGKAEAAAVGAEDWPMFRKDVERSGVAGTEVPARFRLAWSVPLLVGQRPVADWDLHPHARGPLTGAVSAGEVVCLAVPHEHRVVAVNAREGTVRWTFTAGARIDSPPTLHNGLCLFGCRDGWVYALRQGDGALAWRYLAAPEDRRIMAFGQLESLWPVPGSVLPLGDRVFVSAGRSWSTDGGFSIIALDARTGTKVWGMRPDDDFQGINDILQSDGKSLFLHDPTRSSDRVLAIDPADGTSRGVRPVLHRPRQLGFLDQTWDLLRPACEAVYDRTAAWGREDRSHLRVVAGETTFSYQAEELQELDKPDKLVPDSLSAYRAESKLWKITGLPVRARAMLSAGPVLWVAGRSAGGQNAQGLVVAYRAADGTELARYPLDAAPVFEGLSAARGRLFVATEDGRLHCFAGAGQME